MKARKRPRHASEIQGHLQRAFDNHPDKLTLAQLVGLSGLNCSPDSLARKLKGTQALRAQEAERLARALRIDVSITQRAA